MKLAEFPLFFLDIQTTGARPAQAEILEMAWNCSNSDIIEAHLVQLTRGTVPRMIQELTGITDEDMIAAIPLPEVLGKISALSESLRVSSLGGGNLQDRAEVPATCVIHYAQFERPFIEAAFQSIEQSVPFSILCTHEIAKRLLPNLPTRGMKGLAGYFGFFAGDFKRSTGHVQATKVIWQGLVKLLEEKGIFTLEELKTWMTETPKKARTKYEYPLPSEKRLSLPDQPGVYRMLSRWGEVLYVGKATSLKDRVNSYFRGQKNRDTRKLEMLTQVWDLLVTPCNSPLEAALLETDEIKRLNPRYNISLKVGRRALVFFNHDLTSMSRRQDEVHSLGPFSNALVLDSMMKLSQSIREDRFNENMFFDPFEPELLVAGFDLFCERWSLRKNDFTSVRNILAVGLMLGRKDPIAEEDLNLDLEEELEESTEITVEDIADKFARHFVRAGRAYARSRKLTRLLNADIDFQISDNSPQTVLKVRQGQVVQSSEILAIPVHAWENMSIETYDRMTVLYSELEKIRSQQGHFQIKRPTSILSF